MTTKNQKNSKIWRTLENEFLNQDSLPECNMPLQTTFIDSVLSLDDSVLQNMNISSNVKESPVCKRAKRLSKTAKELFKKKDDSNNVESQFNEFDFPKSTFSFSNVDQALEKVENDTECPEFVFEDSDIKQTNISQSDFINEQNESILGDMNDSLNLIKSKIFGSFTTEPIQTENNASGTNNSFFKKPQIRPPENHSFYGLPDAVKSLIKKYKGIDKLYSWQDECLKMKAITERKNLIYALPTSGGKTLVAEILMLKEIICNKKNVIFILPFVALVQEKIQSMTGFALELGFLLEEYAAGKGHYPPKKRRKKNSLYICTIEKASAIINNLIELDRLHEIGVIVVDELHLLGEPGGRGATLEGLLTKVMYVDPSVHIIGMSATIGNLNEIAEFLNADLYTQNFRPIEITEYVKCDKEIWRYDSREEEMFTDRKIITYPYSNEAAQIDPDRIGGLVMDVVPNDSCLIFCSTRKNCENVAILLTKVLFKKLEAHKMEEKITLLSALKMEGDLCPILRKTIKFGVAYHHSGLISEERKLLEDAFRAGTLCVICCTSTLAAGVNLPARRVILRSPYVGNQFLNLSRYKQMIGRAGRAGLGEIGESILICKPLDMPKVKILLNSKMDDSMSSLHIEEDRGIRNIVISGILLSIATTRSKLHELVTLTLMKKQEEKLGISVKSVTDKAISSLLKTGIIKVKEEKAEIENYDITVYMPSQSEEPKTQKSGKIQVILTNNTELELCQLGRAAMKGSMDIQRARVLFNDLKRAQQNLILVDHLHLLYLITPYDLASQVKPVGSVYYDVVSKFSEFQMSVAKLLGITEAVIIRLREGIMPKNVDASIINRFYVTLMLYELWNRKSVFVVGEKYRVNRGIIQNLLTTASSFASSVVRFCEELEEFWAFRELMGTFGQKLTYCCAAELEPLMELPFVKIGRAMQLYKAGYKNLQTIAKATPEELLEKIEHIPKKAVTQIISTAKLLLLEKVENLRDEVEEVLEGLDFEVKC